MRFQRRLLAAFVLVGVLCVAAFAHDVPDLSQMGSIHITMRHGETVVPGGSLTLYRVCRVQEDDGNYSFVPTDDFTDCGQSFEDLQSPDLAKTLAQYAKSLSGHTLPIGEDGTVVFPNLELGLYLLVQQEAADGYLAVAPFLVSVPFMEGDTYVYDVDASPKVNPETTPETEPTEPPAPPEPSLPQTGQLNWPVPVLAVLGLCLFAAGWALRFGKRESSREE